MLFPGPTDRFSVGLSDGHFGLDEMKKFGDLLVDRHFDSCGGLDMEVVCGIPSRGEHVEFYLIHSDWEMLRQHLNNLHEKAQRFEVEIDEKSLRDV